MVLNSCSSGEQGTRKLVDAIVLWRRLLAEFVGTGLLVTVVIGAGIAAQRLSPHNVGLQLLENSMPPRSVWRC